MKTISILLHRKYIKDKLRLKTVCNIEESHREKKQININISMETVCMIYKQYDSFVENYKICCYIFFTILCSKTEKIEMEHTHEKLNSRKSIENLLRRDGQNSPRLQ